MFVVPRINQMARNGEPLFALRARDLPALVGNLRDHREQDYEEINLFEWDCINGLRHTEETDPTSDCHKALGLVDKFKGESGFTKLLEALLALAPDSVDAKRKERMRPGKAKDHLVIVIHGAHLLLSPSAMTLKLVTLLSQIFMDLRPTALRVCLLTHADWSPPAEIRTFMPIIDFGLPEVNHIANAIKHMKREVGGKPELVFKSEEVLHKVAAAAVGVTMTQAESMMANVAREHKDSDVGYTVRRVLAMKLQLINTRKLVTVTDPRDLPDIDNIVGMDGLISHITALYKAKLHHSHPGISPGGVILLGPTGTGKTTLSKCLANYLGIFLVEPQMSQILSSYQGDTEKAWDCCTEIIESVGDCIVHIDEINRVVPRGESGGSTDSGRRLLGQMLSYFGSRKTNAILVGSANTIENLDPAFSRAERIDGVWMVDTPNPSQRVELWDHYFDYFGVLTDEAKRKEFHAALEEHDVDQDWTGAEIKQACGQLFVLPSHPTAVFDTIIPNSRRYASELADMRKWCQGRVLDATTGKPYMAGQRPKAKPPSSPHAEAIVPRQRRNPNLN